MARRPSEVPPARVRELSAGAPSANLAESLSIDFAKLLKATLPDLAPEAHKAMKAHAATPYTKRMAAASTILLEHASAKQRRAVERHPSDTVKGWACYLVGMTAKNADEAIDRIRPFAADGHFGVREWAWLGVRHAIVAAPEDAIGHLAPSSLDASENIRRFASEATRPRGVWSAHIPLLKDNPARGLPILDPLSDDPSRYVQNSVANWLNDAAKTRPDWVSDVCRRWRGASSNAATAYICRRATRSL